MENKNVFEILNNINVSSKVKQKIGLSYLSWADAWSELKKVFPDADYTIYTRDVISKTVEVIEDTQFHTTKTITTETRNAIPYFTDGKTCYVQVGVKIEGVEYVEYLPVMNNKNEAIPVSVITMTAVNKAIQRAFVKACARHGLGLYIYAGEDLPEVDRKAAPEINYEGIEKLVDSEKYEELSSEKIAEIAQNAGQKYNALNETIVSKYLNNYISGLIDTYQIKKLSENAVAIQKFYRMCSELEKALGNDK